MHKQRLLAAAEKLRELQIELEAGHNLDQFNMGVWLRSDKPSCGTTGCFIGWAAVRGWFEADGLTIEMREIPGFTDQQFRPLFKRAGWPDDTHSAVAIGQYFDISMGSANKLTMPEEFGNGDETEPREVAERIEMLVDYDDEDAFNDKIDEENGNDAIDGNEEDATEAL